MLDGWFVLSFEFGGTVLGWMFETAAVLSSCHCQAKFIWVRHGNGTTFGTGLSLFNQGKEILVGSSYHKFWDITKAWRNQDYTTGWKNAEVPFFINFSRWTCHFTSNWKGCICVNLGQNVIRKLFIFTKPTQGNLRKRCFICWSKSHLPQSTGP